jgi:hypothetical protein
MVVITSEIMATVIVKDLRKFFQADPQVAQSRRRLSCYTNDRSW